MITIAPIENTTEFQVVQTYEADGKKHTTRFLPFKEKSQADSFMRTMIHSRKGRRTITN